MQADQRVVHVFLQRHVAHHAHGAKQLGRVLDGPVERLGGEHLRDRLQGQVGKALVRKGGRMIGQLQTAVRSRWQS